VNETVPPPLVHVTSARSPSSAPVQLSPAAATCESGAAPPCTAANHASPTVRARPQSALLAWTSWTNPPTALGQSAGAPPLDGGCEAGAPPPPVVDVGAVVDVVGGTVAGVVTVVVGVVAVRVVAAVEGTSCPLVRGGRSSDASPELEPPHPAGRAASARRSRATGPRRGMPAL
jgi:hypothetical protein